MSTVTVADYAVEFPITPDEYETWYTEEYCKTGGDEENNIPIAMSLKNHLIRYIETTLTEDRMRAANIDPNSKKA